MSVDQLFGEELRVVNVGLDSFAEPVRNSGVDVTTVDWRPPALGDADLGLQLAHLVGSPAVHHANMAAMERILAVQPLWVDVCPAHEAIPALAEERLLLHAGAPIERGRVCGPVRDGVA